MVGIVDFLKKQIQDYTCSFFLDLFGKVYNEICEVGTFEESNILCEFCMLIGCNSKLYAKKWKYTFLMSGESDLRKCESIKDKYDCVLWMQRNNKKIVNLPLHIAYIYTNNFLKDLETQSIRTEVPKNDVLVVIFESKW